MVAGHASDDEFENIERNTGVADQIAVGDTSGSSFGIFAEASYALAVAGPDGAGLTVAPLGRVSSVSVDVDAYTESGAVGLDQIVFDRETDPSQLEAGARLSGEAGLRWRVEGVYVEAVDEDAQRVRTALVTVPEVVRDFETDGTDGSYGRISGGAALDLAGMTFEIGGETTAGRDDADQWAAYVRAGRAF